MKKNEACSRIERHLIFSWTTWIIFLSFTFNGTHAAVAAPFVAPKKGTYSISKPIQDGRHYWVGVGVAQSLGFAMLGLSCDAGLMINSFWSFSLRASTASGRYSAISVTSIDSPPRTAQATHPTKTPTLSCLVQEAF